MASEFSIDRPETQSELPEYTQKIVVDDTTLSNVQLSTEQTTPASAEEGVTMKAEPNSSLGVKEAKENSAEITSKRIVDIIASYGVQSPNSDAKHQFLSIVREQVSNGASVKMLLPGFPFKSESSKLVLGALPDLAESLALRHLQGLCDSIAAVYEKGAEVHICSDGLVYNDLLNVSDEAVWSYGEALRDMALSDGLQSIKFLRLWDVLDHPARLLYTSNKEAAKTYYVQHAACIRRELVQYGHAQGSAGASVKSDKTPIRSTYVDVLSRQNANDPDGIATTMLHRGKAYAAALQTALPGFLRLSIHNPTGDAKISIPLIPRPGGPQSDVGLMPWRSAIAVDADGSYRAVFPKDVEDTHETVYKDGRPYFLRVKSDGISQLEVSADPLMGEAKRVTDPRADHHSPVADTEWRRVHAMQ
ncbi:Pyoverdine/dityrosine biosynthesis protein-domain-containing protein [Xylariomycetidae sp. FL2044]|nr:Pyoverdine/dityrosine biosynthesis protein-domain-containing protein [Xylariomycetidae sp. FL2044]